MAYYEQMAMFEEDRNSLVVKHNDLLRKSRYSLTTTEQKTLIYLISKVKADDKDFEEVEISIHDLCNLMGLEVCGAEYNLLKSSLKSLRAKSWWIDLGDDKGTEILFSWIDTVELIRGEGIARIRLSNSLKPYLLELKENFTKYELINVLALKSGYSVRLYELFKSYLWVGNWKVSLEEIKEILQIKDKYPEFKILKRDVLERALKEINTYTDIVVEMETIRSGRKIAALKFNIREKQGSNEALNTWRKQRERLG